MVVRMNQNFEQVFGWERKEIWQCFILVNCIHISEIDVKLLNFSIRISVDQVMVFLL